MERTLFNATTAEDVEFCLNRGDNIESSRNKIELWSSRAITPFLYHCRVNKHGNKDVVVALINAGCDVTRRNLGSMTGLDIICNEGHSDLLSAILKFPKIRDLINPVGQNSPLIYSCRHAHCDIFDILIKNGANVRHRGIKGNFPLKEAVYYNKPVIVRKLLDNGAEITDVDDNGQTCLHIPLVNIECLDLILCYGGLSIINKQDNNGKTPLIVATEHINRDVIERLVDCGADITISDKDGKTPLTAVEEGMMFDKRICSYVPSSDQTKSTLINLLTTRR